MADDAVFEASGFKNLRSELKAINTEMQQLILSGQEGSAKFTELGKRAGQIKDAVEDASDAQKSFTGAGQFQAVTKAVQGVVGGFQAVQGAIALAGGSSKEFEKTMLKLQGAMALTQGLAALEDVPRAFKQIGTVGVNAFKAIKAAIGATGIGLLVLALGTIVAYWDEITAAISGVTEEQETLNAATAKQLEANEANLAAVEGSEQIMKLQGKTEEEIYNIKLKAYDTTIQSAKASLTNAKITRDAQIEAAERNKKILQGIIMFLTAPLQILLYTVDQVGKALGQDFGLVEGFAGGLAKLVFDPEETKKEGDKTIKAAEDKLRQLEEKRAGLVNGFNDKKKAKNEKIAQDAASADEKENQKQLDAIKRQQQAEDELYIAQAANEQERERRTLERKQQRGQEELQAEIDKYDKIKTKTKEEEETLNELKKALGLRVLADKEALNDLLDKQANDQNEKNKAAAKQEFEDTKGYVEAFYKAKETEILNSGKTQEEIESDLEKNELARLDALKVAYQDYGQSVVDIDLEKAKKLNDIRKKEEEEEKKSLEDRKKARQEATQATLELASSTLSQLIDLEKTALDAQLSNQELSEAEREKIAKDSFEKQKKLQIALALVDAAKTTTSILAQYPKFDGGIAMFAALAATAITLGVAIAKIKAVQYVSPNKATSAKKDNTGSMYQDGGMLYGPGHDLGGIRSSMGELEGGEFVVNRRSAANFLPLLESINSLGNTPGPQVQMQQTPIVKTYVVATDVTSAQEANARIAALARM
jgi:hypothetical protein